MLKTNNRKEIKNNYLVKWKKLEENKGAKKGNIGNQKLMARRDFIRKMIMPTLQFMAIRIKI